VSEMGEALHRLLDAAPASTRPDLFLQWKGTDACLDLYCACGQDLHFDGYFAHELTCGHCGQTWELPHKLAVTPVEPSRQLTLIFDETDVIGDGEFDITWPRPSFDAAKPGGILEIHQVADSCARSAYADLLKVTPQDDGTVRLTVRNRGTGP
jgi:hypothetical protein